MSVADITLALQWRHIEERKYWDMVRLLGFWFLQPYDSKRKIKKPEQLLTMPWEQSQRKPLTHDDVKKLFEQLDKRRNGEQ